MERAAGIGFWELTVLMVVIASWLLYRYVAPRSWREWTRAGLIQAFIIALYAEMYGFPLTIYVLSGFLGWDIPWLHESGHLWATLFGWGDLGAMVEMVIGYGLLFFGVSLLMEGWREVHQASREGRLAVDRAYVRLARREEREMLERFGEEYGEYRRRVPMFFPRRGEWRRLLDETRASSGERP